jgi:hypothetical protein
MAWVVSVMSWPCFTPGKDPRYPLDRRLSGAQELVWTQRLEKSALPLGDRTPVVQYVVRHYTDWATPAPALGFISDLTTVNSRPTSEVLTALLALLPERERTNEWTCSVGLRHDQRVLYAHPAFTVVYIGITLFWPSGKYMYHLLILRINKDFFPWTVLT